MNNLVLNALCHLYLREIEKSISGDLDCSTNTYPSGTVTVCTWSKKQEEQIITGVKFTPVYQWRTSDPMVWSNAGWNREITCKTTLINTIKIWSKDKVFYVKYHSLHIREGKIGIPIEGRFFSLDQSDRQLKKIFKQMFKTSYMFTDAVNKIRKARHEVKGISKYSFYQKP
jgi:hypothetical protein